MRTDAAAVVVIGDLEGDLAGAAVVGAADERTIRLGVDRSTHLLMRSVVKTVNEDTRERQEDVTVYSNYQPKDGVQVPMQITRERDGRRLSQVFYESCQLNPQLPPDLFTRASLERRYKELGGGKNKGK